MRAQGLQEELREEHALVHVDLQIEELVLHGVEPRQRYAVGEAIERELARLVVDRGIPDVLRTSDELTGLEAPGIQVEHGATAEGLGLEVARAVYGVLGS
ncbi:MAG: hypothetical protein M3N31_09355 [Actinomycetota bacterium]|nr:hypothetical protein [Actinomycetota bacterium]